MSGGGGSGREVGIPCYILSPKVGCGMRGRGSGDLACVCEVMGIHVFTYINIL